MDYDIFISCKSEDYSLAREVHNFLCENRYNVFLADVELHKIGKAQYGEIIDYALDTAKHFILFASRPEYVKSTYVNEEWRIFLEELRCGRKSGNILTIRNGFAISELPISLRNLQSFTYDNYQSYILDYLPIELSYSDYMQRLISAAELGNAQDQYELGSSYFSNVDFSSGGEFVQDYSQAVKWYSKSAEQGHIEAQVQLGICYANGLGVDKNKDKAYYWWKKAAEQGHESAISFMKSEDSRRIIEQCMKGTISPGEGISILKQKNKYRLILRSANPKPVVMKAIKNVLGIGLMKAKNIVENTPYIIHEANRWDLIGICKKIENQIPDKQDVVLDIEEINN